MASQSSTWTHWPLIAVALLVWPGPRIVETLRARHAPELERAFAQGVTPAEREARPATPVEWMERMRPWCTDRDVDLFTDLNPAPPSDSGVAHEAACFALAGRVPQARARLLGLDPAARASAAGVVYDVAATSLATETDPRVGPIMELVLEFWPNHHLALYHAGSARHVSGDLDGAGRYLEQFLELYVYEDARTDGARRMLMLAEER